MIVFGLYTAVPLYAIIALLVSRFIMAMYTDVDIKIGIDKLPNFKRIKNLGLLLVPVITVGLFLVIKFLGLPLACELVILAILGVVSIDVNQALVIHLDSLKREVV
ncbi:hypothetical protein RZE82_08950 [Mollicutes bacterium LVI A0039]|nr:hypothetical protein RZE82_08950 [Mollicutes bacterium LVI A0039]